MIERSIFCKKCNCPLGVLRDARIRKDIVFLCTPCEIKLTQLAATPRGSIYEGFDAADVMDSLFKRGK